jgi:hypothetical protein
MANRLRLGFGAKTDGGQIDSHAGLVRNGAELTRATGHGKPQQLNCYR